MLHFYFHDLSDLYHTAILFLTAAKCTEELIKCAKEKKINRTDLNDTAETDIVDITWLCMISGNFIFIATMPSLIP